MITLYDIKNRKGENYKHRGRLANLLRKRIIEVCGHGVDVDDFHIACASDNSSEYVIRHKHVQCVNSATIEPFVKYGVEYVSVNLALSNKKHYSRTFDTVTEAVAFANKFDVSDYIRKLSEPKHSNTKSSNEELQRLNLNGRTIFELIDAEFTLNKQRIKRARYANDVAKVETLERHARKLRQAVWDVEDNANLAWSKQDSSLFKPNPLFPTINSVMHAHFSNSAKAA